MIGKEREKNNRKGMDGEEKELMIEMHRQVNGKEN
jgi:hypothetical protein